MPDVDSLPPLPVTGTGTPGYSVGDNTSLSMGSTAAINTPTGLAVDSLGHIYFCDSGNFIIRRVQGIGTPPSVCLLVIAESCRHADLMGHAAW